MVRGIAKGGRNDSVVDLPLDQHKATGAYHGSVTLTRTSSAWVADWEGIYREAVSGEAPIQGGRRVENLASGNGTQSVTVVSGNDYQVTIGSGSASGAKVVCSNAFTGTLTGDATNRLSWASGTPKTAGSTTLTLTVTGTITDLFVEDVSGQSNQNPSEFTSSPVWKNCKNGNTVDANGVVTEAHGATLIPDGMLLENAATNEALHCRDFTQAGTWTATNITTAKDATGIDGAANSASTLTASAASGTIFQTITLASASYATSFFVKRKTGTGTIEITEDGGATYTDITSSINSSTYSRVSSKKTQANPQIGFRITTSGDEIEVDFAQCETDVVTSPIETTTGSATRAATSYSVPCAGNYQLNDMSGYMEYLPDAGTGSSIYLMDIQVDGNNRIWLVHNTSAWQFNKRISGVNHASSKIEAMTLSLHKIAWSISSVDGVKIVVDGVEGTAQSDTTDFPSLPANAFIGSTSGGSLNVQGTIKNNIVYDYQLSAAQMVAMTT